MVFQPEEYFVSGLTFPTLCYFTRKVPYLKIYKKKHIPALQMTKVTIIQRRPRRILSLVTNVLVNYVSNFWYVWQMMDLFLAKDHGEKRVSPLHVTGDWPLNHPWLFSGGQTENGVILFDFRTFKTNLFRSERKMIEKATKCYVNNNNNNNNNNNI